MTSENNEEILTFKLPLASALNASSAYIMADQFIQRFIFYKSQTHHRTIDIGLESTMTHHY